MATSATREASTYGPPAEPAHGAHADDRGFVRKYVFSTDHKIIGIQFLIMSLFFLLVGGTLAMLIRWQLGFPGQPAPGAGALPETMAQGGVLLPEFYTSLVTMHGTFMVFFAIMPLLVGVFGNYLIPLKIGAPDNTGMASSTRHAVTNSAQMLSGSRNQFIPGARRLITVVM